MVRTGFLGTRARINLVLLVGLAAVASTPPTTSAGDRARQWVAAHPAARPSTLAALAAYPADYRTEIYARLDPATKYAMWRTQIREGLADQSLTAQQRTFLEGVMNRLSPADFSVVDSAKSANLCREVGGVFPVGHRELTAARNIGAFARPDRTYWSWLANANAQIGAARQKLWGPLHAGLMEVAHCDCTLAGFCECGIGASDCVWNNDQVWVCNPNDTDGQCGCIWPGSCYGKCVV